MNTPLSERGFLFDIDNTLTNSAKNIAEPTQRALRQLAQTGAKMGVCTGRSYPEIVEHILPFFDDHCVHVLSGGAQVMTQHGEVLFEQKLPHELVQEICIAVKNLGGSYGFTATDVYAGSDKTLEYKQGQKWNIPLSSSEDIKEWSTCLLSVFFLTPAVEQYVESLSGVVWKKMFSSAGDAYYDITAQGVTKALGAQKWSEIQGIPLEHITAFGDGANDEEVLQAVGWGVAMGNAADALKEVANEVIAPTDEDGVAQYLTALMA